MAIQETANFSAAPAVELDEPDWRKRVSATSRVLNRDAHYHVLGF